MIEIRSKMKKIVICLSVLLGMTACVEQTKENLAMEESKVGMKADSIAEGEVIAGINLTVAEGKRLIAKGIANHPAVKAKLQKGIIVITSGSTNTYIAEELAGLTAPHGSFMTGNITPQGTPGVGDGLERVPNITLIDGKKANIDYEDALKQMGEGDIVFKGGNMLNYEKKQVAVCIGAPDGGTTKRVRTVTTGTGKAKLIVPIGLEKQVYGDLNDYEKIAGSKTEQLSYVPRVWVHQNAEIFTEIEALKTFASVKIIPFAAGGLAGREGGISLAVYGMKEEVQKVLDVVAAVQGEAPFKP